MFQLFITWRDGEQDTVTSPTIETIRRIRNIFRWNACGCKVRIWDCRNRRFVS